MIVAIVTFKLPKRWTVAEAAKVFNSTAPKYLGKAGLVRKHYYITEAGDRAGGIYLFASRAQGLSSPSQKSDEPRSRERSRCLLQGCTPKPAAGTSISSTAPDVPKHVGGNCIWWL